MVARLDEITGIGPYAAQVIIAELGLDMSQFPTADQLADLLWMVVMLPEFQLVR